MRLIDADALKEEVNKKKVVGRFNTLLLIDNAPTVEERPQGEWIFRQGVTCGGYYKCNKCGEVERAEKNYCSNCGAYMKGKKNENKD